MNTSRASDFHRYEQITEYSSGNTFCAFDVLIYACLRPPAFYRFAAADYDTRQHYRHADPVCTVGITGACKMGQPKGAFCSHSLLRPLFVPIGVGVMQYYDKFKAQFGRFGLLRHQYAGGFPVVSLEFTLCMANVRSSGRKQKMMANILWSLPLTPGGVLLLRVRFAVR